MKSLKVCVAKITVIVALLLCSVATSYAAKNALQIKLKDGTSAVYVFSMKPVVRFVSDEMTITTEYEQVSFPKNAVSQFLFVEATDAVKTLSANDFSFRRINNNEMEVASVQPVRVYDSSGLLQSVQTTLVDGMTHLTLHKLRAGVYFIRTNQQTIKIIKK